MTKFTQQWVQNCWHWLFSSTNRAWNCWHKFCGDRYINHVTVRLSINKSISSIARNFKLVNTTYFVWFSMQQAAILNFGDIACSMVCHDFPYQGSGKTAMKDISHASLMCYMYVASSGKGGKMKRLLFPCLRCTIVNRDTTLNVANTLIGNRAGIPTLHTNDMTIFSSIR